MKSTPISVDSDKLDTATFGAGCFWCTEAIFQRLKGVEKVVSGFSGGKIENPSYEQISQGNTEHAEVCQIFFNPVLITYSELLEVFWKIHNPTTLNRQGNDIGTQYRSVIFYHTEDQKKQAISFKEKLTEEKIFDKKIVTTIEPLTVFFPAEKYHQNYYNQNPNQIYCQYLILPKIEKFKKIFKDKMKNSK